MWRCFHYCSLTLSAKGLNCKVVAMVDGTADLFSLCVNIRNVNLTKGRAECVLSQTTIYKEMIKIYSKWRGW